MGRNSSNNSEDIVQPDEVTADFLYTLFHDAYFNVNRDEAGDVYLSDTYTTWLFPQQNGEQIRLMSQFTSNPEVSRTVKLEYVNSINDKLKLLRAYVDSADDIGFDYYIPVEGGTTKRTIVMAVRRFIDYVRRALQKDEQNVLG